MLILLLIVGKRLAKGSRPFPYSPGSSPRPRERASGYPGLDGTPFTATDPAQAAAGYPVPCPSGGGLSYHPSDGLSSESKISIANYCLRPLFAGCASKPGMLPYPFYLLSKPNDPRFIRAWARVCVCGYKNTKIVPEFSRYYSIRIFCLKIRPSRFMISTRMIPGRKSRVSILPGPVPS